MFEEKRKVLVTGASGFVGGAVIRELSKSGKYGIVALCRKAMPKEEIGPTPVEYYQADIADDTTFTQIEAVKPIGTLIHTAGLAHQFGRVSREDFWKINVRGTDNICRLAKRIGVRQLILTSSVAVYGDHGKAEIVESFECRPKGVYAESKLESERRAAEFCRKHDIALTVLRLATVVGEGDRGNNARLITLIDEGKFLWVGRGTNKKTLIYVKDAAKGIVKTLDDGNERSEIKIYNLTGEALSMSEIVGAMAAGLNKTVPRISIPENLARAVLKASNAAVSNERIRKALETLEKWLSDDIFSGRKFEHELRFRPETPVSEALARQVVAYLADKKRLSEASGT